MAALPQSLTFSSPTFTALYALSPPPSPLPTPPSPHLPTNHLATYTSPPHPPLNIHTHTLTPSLALLSATCGPYTRSYTSTPPCTPPSTPLPTLLPTSWPPSCTLTIHTGWFQPRITKPPLAPPPVTETIVVTPHIAGKARRAKTKVPRRTVIEESVIPPKPESLTDDVVKELVKRLTCEPADDTVDEWTPPPFDNVPPAVLDLASNYVSTVTAHLTSLSRTPTIEEIVEKYKTGEGTGGEVKSCGVGYLDKCVAHYTMKYGVKEGDKSDATATEDEETVLTTSLTGSEPHEDNGGYTYTTYVFRTGTGTSLKRYSELAKWAAASGNEEGFPGKFERGREDKLKEWCKAYPREIGEWLVNEM